MPNTLNLFEFENYGTDGNINQLEGAPRLVKPGTSSSNQSLESKQYIAAESKDFFTIDVVREFQWSTTPPSGRQEVPVVNFREKRLKTNSLMAQAAYYSATFAGVTNDAVNKLGNASPAIKSMVGAIAGGMGAGSISQAAGLGATGSLLGKLFGAAGGAAVSNINGITSSVTDLADALGKAGLSEIDSLPPEIANAISIPSLNSSVLRPYEGLYLTEDTKFCYSFPYLENGPNYVENMFGDQDEAFSGKVPHVPSLGSIMKEFRTSTQAMAALTNITQPGVYIEKPKFFQFNDKGEEITFSFPLINTGHSTWQDVRKNWQLLFMLIYQNRPNRRSRDLIDPPCLYEVNIPGIKFMPYAYISNLSIEFIGNRRQQLLDIPGVDGSVLNIATIIPDAYQVNITVTGLVSEAQNMLFAMITDKQGKITTSELGNTSFGSFIAQAAESGRNRNVREISTSLDGGASIPPRGNTTIPGVTP